MAFPQSLTTGPQRLTASLTLPCSPALSMPSNHGATILVVDGESQRRSAIRDALRGSDYCFLEARTTTAALEHVFQHPVDLIISDLQAPSDGAAGLCGRIRSSSYTQFLPILVTAINPHTDKEVEAIEAGADAILSNTSTLRASVQACLKKKAALEALDQTETVLFTLAQSVEERDPALGRHCERLSLLSAAMGVALGLSREELLALQRGGYLHDIGKVVIPDSVLFKPGPLNDDEWVVMKSHTERGERICANVQSLANVLPIIRSHHERWDGTGYPDKLKGEEIPLLARIMQMSDIYDALTTERPYKRAFTPAQAASIMREEAQKGWRDPELTNTFIDLLPVIENGPELSGLSLQALAGSMDRYRKHPGRVEASIPEGLSKLVSGL